MSSLRMTFGLFLLALPALAEESGAGVEKPGMLLWQVLNFLILAGLLGWLVVKQGGPFLASRAQGIREGLAAGERAKKEAETRGAEVQKKLDHLQTEIAAMRSRTHEELEREAERLRGDAQAEIARMRSHAEQEIESAGKQASLELQRASARIAVELAEKKVRARMSADVQASLLHDFVSDLSNGAAKAVTNAD